ncbi:MAG TPA: RNA polymerase sigma factor [Vicinamibacterales bacterium]|nr:RNA polymerase sigma factor [Vicinamibacterales bacterium]
MTVLASSALPTAPPVEWTEDALVEGARARHEAAIRELMQRYNQRLFRMARSVLRSDVEAEDAVQDGWIQALTHLEGFRGEAAFGTWLTRIVMNEALGRVRKQRTRSDINVAAGEAIPSAVTTETPESIMAQGQIRTLLETAIDRLPDSFRSVFVARMVEGLSVEETALVLGLKPETVKTRAHRARARLRTELSRSIGPAMGDAFAFQGERCARMTEAVLRRLFTRIHEDTENR